MRSPRNPCARERHGLYLNASAYEKVISVFQAIVTVRAPNMVVSTKPRLESGKPSWQCAECKISFEPGFNIREHMVAVHGYVQEGKSVFKRKFCFCGKPGLYAFGSQAVCKDHVRQAQARVIRRNNKFFGPLDKDRRRQAVDFDTYQLGVTSFHEGSRRKPKQ